MSEFEKKIRNVPLYLIVIYITATFLLSILGPMKYIDYEYWRVALYLALIILFFALGFNMAHKNNVFKRKIRISKNTGKFGNKIQIRKVVRISIVIALTVCILEFLQLLQSNPDLFNISNVGSNYLIFRENLDNQGYSLAILLRFFTAFFRNVAIILGMYYLKEETVIWRIIWGIFVVLLLFNNVIGYGTQKVLGDFVIYTIIIVGIRILRSKPQLQLKVLGACLILGVAAVFGFALIQSARSESIGLTAANYASRSDGLAYYDLNHPIFKIFGEQLGFGLSTILSSYLSSGYYGLSLCLQLPFVFCWGVGNSYALSVFANRFLGWENMYYHTYLYRMEETFGRNGLRSWNTVFPWLASDLSYFGVIILFFIVGYFWSKAWDEILEYRNPLAILLFANLTMGLIFIPANNQLFSGIDACMTTPFVILAYALFHKSFNKKEG